MSGAVQSVVTVAGRAGVAALALALVLHGSTKRPPVHKVAAPAPAAARELTDDDFARGFVVCRVGMGEAHDFSPPPNAVAVADWRAFGAAEDWVYLDLASRGWSYRVGANRATRLRVHSSGRVEPLVSGGGAALVPVCATLGIVPEANWGRLPESARPSGVWYALTPSNTLQLTWRNALVGRRADAPATFQCELWPDGRADFRYDLSRIPVGTADGLRASVSLGGESWSAAVPRDGALSLRPIDPVDRDSPDRDGDGLPAVDEVLAHGTDPGCDDTDLDGLLDPDELAAGTDPRTPDTDGDGLSDGEEVALGTDPLAADGDGDGLSDFGEVCVHGTDPLRVDTDGDGLPDAEEIARGTSPLAADTDGDGVSDGEEVGWASDPADASDGGRPASCVPVAFHFGDPSGSDSEKYRLVVRPTRGPEGESPDAGYSARLSRWYERRGENNSDKNRHYCFRIRTRRDAEGRIVSGLYGKVYGDFRINDLSGIAFTYYLNPTPNDRNLEFDRKTNFNLTDGREPKDIAP